MAQGKGLLKTPRRAFNPACLDKAMHKDDVNTMSTLMATRVGPAAPGPSRLTNNGMPIKPEFGKAATKAPKDALFQSTSRRWAIARGSARARPTKHNDPNTQTAKIWGFKN